MKDAVPHSGGCCGETRLGRNDNQCLVPCRALSSALRAGGHGPGSGGFPPEVGPSPKLTGSSLHTGQKGVLCTEPVARGARVT